MVSFYFWLEGKCLREGQEIMMIKTNIEKDRIDDFSMKLEQYKRSTLTMGLLIKYRLLLNRKQENKTAIQLIQKRLAIFIYKNEINYVFFNIQTHFL